MAVATLKNAGFALQKAIYSDLDGNITDLSSNTVDVIDHIPRGSDGSPELPGVYIVLGERFAQDRSTKTTSAQIITQRLYVESEFRGWEEIEDVASQIIQRLDRTQFDLSGDGFHVYKAKYEDSEPLRVIEENTGRERRRMTIDIEYRIQST